MKRTPNRTSSIEPLEARIAPAAVSSINLSSLDGTDGYRIQGIAESDFAGGTATAAGDVNGDGFADVIIAAFLADGGGNSRGESYVVFGKAGGFPANLNLSALNGTNGFKLSGASDFDLSGKSVSGAGDVNNDGFDDLIVGAANAAGGGSARGATYVIFGKASGFTANFALSTLDGTNGFKLNGAANGESSGISVDAAGDVNGDGFGDIIIGAYRASGAGSDRGVSYVVFGQAGGFAATVDLGTLNGVAGFTIRGETNGDQSGFQVSGAGDVNGDGFDDVLIGTIRADEGGLDRGAAYVVFGKASGFTANFDLSGLDGSNGFKMNGLADGDAFGSSVESAGDVNGDGFGDIIIGAYSAEGAAPDSGVSYVIFGKASGFTASLSPASLDGTNGFRLLGVTQFDFAGKSGSAAGDLNGDGFGDIIVGAIGANDGTTTASSGTSYVIFGKAGGFAASIPLSSLDGTNGFRLVGVADMDFSGSSVHGVGDVNGDGRDDLIIGAPGSSNSGAGGGPDYGASYIVFGVATNGGGGPVTISPNGKIATVIDVDGDQVSVKTTKGTFTAGMFDLRAEGLGFQLEGLNLTDPLMAKTNLTFKARPVAGAGNKLVNVGSITTAFDLGKVKLPGDLGQLDAGDGDDSGLAIKSLGVSSLSALGPGTQAPGALDPLHSHFHGAVGKIKIKGDFGSPSVSVSAAITARGVLDPAKAKAAVAIKSLTVGGNVLNANILAGYDATGAGVNPDAGIGKVTVKGNWSASSLVAGVLDAAMDGFGRGDTLIPEPVADDIVARIASLTIKGTATGSATPTTDFFGITAQAIGKAKIGKTKLDLDGDADLLLDETNNDFRLVEVSPIG